MTRDIDNILYHITTVRNYEKIMEDGYIKPKIKTGVRGCSGYETSEYVWLTNNPYEVLCNMFGFNYLKRSNLIILEIGICDVDVDLVYYDHADAISENEYITSEYISIDKIKSVIEIGYKKIF